MMFPRCGDSCLLRELVLRRWSSLVLLCVPVETVVHANADRAVCSVVLDLQMRDTEVQVKNNDQIQSEG